MADYFDIEINITIAQFLEFLSGQPVEGCGDKGKEALDVTFKVIHFRFREQLEVERNSRKPDDDGVLPLVNEYKLLDNVLNSAMFPISSHLEEADFPTNVVQIIRSWIRAFGVYQVLPGRGIKPRDGRKSDMENFLEKGDLIFKIREFNYSLDEKIASVEAIKDSRLEEIVSSLMACMKEFLSALSLIEISHMQQSDSPRSASPPIVGSQNSQDAVTPEFDEWLGAWKVPYHGPALRYLETKLQLNVRAARGIGVPVSETDNKRSMSRIIPLVQSSGTGKSRLAEESYIHLIASLNHLDT
jgi:hypothetical protein